MPSAIVSACKDMSIAEKCSMCFYTSNDVKGVKSAMRFKTEQF